MLTPLSPEWNAKRRAASRQVQSSMVQFLQERFPARGAARLEYPSGGSFLFTGADAASTYASGFGLTGPVTEAELDQVELDSRRMCGYARFSVGEQSHPGFLDQLNQRGYRSHANMNAMEWHLPHGSVPLVDVPGLRIGVVQSNEEQEDWVDALAQGFHGAPPNESFHQIFMGLGFHSCASAYSAIYNGTCVGGGVMTYFDGVVNLHATAIRPGHPPRGLGIQRALLAVRVRDALAKGAEIITSSTSTDPSDPSHRNLAAMGFVPVPKGVSWRMWRDF